MQSVPLKRRFTPVPSAYQKDDLPLDELWAGLPSGNEKHWEDLLGEFRVVILAESGAGKTYELESVSKRLVAEGKPAFFIRIEDVHHDFSTAFEVGTAESFEKWLNGTGEAWFFLDSIDEIRLSEPRAFELAIRGFAQRIRTARQRAHIYISSRPYAWRPALDRALIEEVLPFDPLLLEATSDDDSTDEFQDDVVSDGDYPVATRGAGKLKEQSVLQLYQLAPLDKTEIRTFAEHIGVEDSADFIDALERRSLFSLARLPFDLHDLIETWRETSTLVNRLSILKDGIRRQLTTSHLCESYLVLERAEAGAQLIAIAALLTGRPNIRLPGSTSPGALDAELLLPNWTAIEITALLKTGVFGDPIFGAVRFRHREIRELLAALWIKEQISRASMRPHLEMHIFRTQYEENILTPRLRPVLPWLIIFDEAIRDRVLANFPEVALEGGDPARLPVDVRRNMLSVLIDKLIDPTSGLRGFDNAAIAKIAHADLQDHVLTLIEKYSSNDDAIFVLGRLVWQGEMRNCVPCLADIAANPAHGIYARLVSMRAVACLGSSAQLYVLWGALNTNAMPIPRRLLGETIDYAPATIDAIYLILASIDNSEPRKEFESTGLTHALNGFIERLPLATTPEADELLLVFAEGLLQYLKREPLVERGECHVSQVYRWLMSPALHCVERLIVAHSPAALSHVSLSILASAPALKFWQGDDYQDRRSIVDDLVPQWPELNDALYWWTVAEFRRSQVTKGERFADDWGVSWMEHFWAFDETSFARTVGWIRSCKIPDDRLVALSRAVRIYVENGQSVSWLTDLRNAVAGDPELEAALGTKLNPQPSPAVKRYEQSENKYRRTQERHESKNAQARAQFVARLCANPSIVRHPPILQPGQLSTEQYHLLRTIESNASRNSRSRGADWKALIPEFGLAVAEAYRDAAIAFWRVYRAGVRSEGIDTSTIPYALIFAMSGLGIELGESGSAATLDRSDVKMVLRYVVWELNGFPFWFEDLYREWPKLSQKFIWKELVWELEQNTDHSLHYVLHDLVFYAPWLHSDLGPLLCNWLSQNQAPNFDCLRYCRAIMMGGGVPAIDIAALAMRKIYDSETPSEQVATWYALLTDTDPARALPILGSLYGSGDIADPDDFGNSFNVALLGGRHGTSPIFGKFKTPSYLKELYVLAHNFVRVADDINRAGKGVYSPTLRDDAQDARERILGLLTQIPGEMTYRAILGLSTDHPAVSYRGYMRAKAYQLAVDDGDIQSWKTSEVLALAKRLARYPIITSITGGDGSAKA